MRTVGVVVGGATGVRDVTAPRGNRFVDPRVLFVADAAKLVCRAHTNARTMRARLYTHWPPPPPRRGRPVAARRATETTGEQHERGRRMRR